MSESTEEFDANELDKMLEGIHIPSQPKIMIDVVQECRKAEPNLPDIAKIISSDVGLASAVLRTINSPFFGMRREIESINQAVMLLGIKNVSNLVTSYSLRQSFSGRCAISLERFWDTATDVANISAAIANKKPLQVSPDEAYMLGLFIDCGIPILATKYEDYKSVLMEGNKSPDREMTEIEDDHYQTNHATIGYLTSRSWGLSVALRKAILEHHDIENLYLNNGDIDEVRKDNLIAIQKMAENIAHTSRHLSEHHDWERVKHKTLEYAGLNETDYQDLKDDIHELMQSD